MAGAAGGDGAKSPSDCLTAVVVTWNSAADVRRLAGSARTHLGGACRLLFVDNASEDGTIAVIRSAAPDSEVIELHRNHGFAEANNIGVRAAATDVVALLNPDTELVDASLQRLAMHAGRGRALFGPRLLNDDGSAQISAFPPLSGWEAGLIAIWPGELLPARIRRRCEPWRSNERASVGWLSAACIVAQRDVLIELGPFDPELALYGEDTDLGVRARQRGVPSIFAPDLARIIHVGSRSGAQAFADVGMERKIQARRWVARHRLGRVRATVDALAQFLLHATRWAAKRTLGRDASVESLWLRTAVRLAGGAPAERALPRTRLR